jgi:hypothetical protein
MKLKLTVICLVGGLAFAAAQQKAQVAYEVPPVVEVAAQFPAEILHGPHHRVRATAPSDGYLNHYTIDSDYGVFECAGRQELGLRVREIDAIAKLVEVSKSDIFAEGLKRSIEKPIDAVKNIVDNPVESVKAVPKTVGHFFKRVGSSIGNTAKRVEDKIEGSRDEEIDAGQAIADTGKGIGRGAKSAAGFDKAKLDTARQLGVDPYSDNERLQEEMEKVTWAFFAGGMPLRVVGIATGAGIALTATNTIGMPEDIYDVTPSELALRDRKTLELMGADGELIDTVINGQMLSVSMRHGIVSHLSKLPGAGRVDIMRVATGLQQPRQAAFLERALAVLVERHIASPYVNVKSFGRLPAGITADGIMEVAAPVDYVSWTEQIANFANSDDLKGKRRLLINGAMSSIAKDRFEATGWEVLSLR